MADKYGLLIYPEAQEEINSAFNYISTVLCAPSAALALSCSLKKAIDNVRYFPHSCSVYKTSCGFETRRLLINNFLAIYIADDTAKIIRLVRFFYSKRNYNDLQLFESDNLPEKQL